MSQIEQIEISMDKAKRMITLSELFDDMAKTKAFKEIIEENYFGEEPKRLAFLLSDANFQDENSQKEIQAGLIGVGQLFHYFKTIKQLATQARNSLEADERTHTELLEEED